MERSHVRRGASGLLTALAVALTGCGGDTPTTPGGGGGGGGGGGTTPTVTTSVSVGNNFFSPADIQVSPGATVTWTWNSSGTQHNVTFPSTAIGDSPNQPSGTFSTAMPTTPGTYNYSCTLHSGMDGSVLVM